MTFPLHCPPHPKPATASQVVVMGVAGCGKSSVGAALATAEGLALIEGDDHHSEANRRKMSQGIPLDDADRADWLSALGAELRAHAASGAVLTCSALKAAYRARLRGFAPDLRFVFLDLDLAAARLRVAARPGHFFSSALVDTQFATLERPDGEPGVLRLDATRPVVELQRAASAWLRDGATGPGPVADAAIPSSGALR